MSTSPDSDTLFAALETPAPLVDLDRLECNLARTAAYAAAHGLALRPHVKTHKSRFVAEEQIRHGVRALTCATPMEAEIMSALCDDLLIAYPAVGAARARRVAAINPGGRLTVALDSTRAADDLAHAARAANRTIGVYVEIDVGMHRVGFTNANDAVALARYVAATRGLEFTGVTFYPGHVRSAVSEQDASLTALADTITRTLDAFDSAGLTPRVVSGGSTPTLWRSHELPRVTEIRPGSYVYNDRTTAAIGACAWGDCALTVLTTVISTAVPGQAVIDAGSKALGREPLRSAEGEGFGQLLEYPEVTVERMSEEHGIVDLSRTGWRPYVGERVRVVPNHVCIVTQLNDLVYGVRGDALESSWPVDARGRGYAPTPAR